MAEIPTPPWLPFTLDMPSTGFVEAKPIPVDKVVIVSLGTPDGRRVAAVVVPQARLNRFPVLVRQRGA